MTPSEIQKKLAQLGLRTTKIRGQHFLIDEQVLAAICRAAELERTDTVLEIGSGLGVLTGELLARAGCVIGVEVDFGFARYLDTEFTGRGLHVVRGNVLEIDTKTLIAGCGLHFKLVANIPYNITSAILEKFLEGEPTPHLIVLLVQKEVAERVTAGAGDMNRLAAFVQYFGKPEIIRTVGKHAFWPVPQVDSAILRIRRHSEYFLRRREAEVPYQFFSKVMRVGFLSPRKKLVNNLAGHFGTEREVVTVAMKKAGIDTDLRPEDVSFEKWIHLCVVLRE